MANMPFNLWETWVLAGDLEHSQYLYLRLNKGAIKRLFSAEAEVTRDTTKSEIRAREEWQNTTMWHETDSWGRRCVFMIQLRRANVRLLPRRQLLPSSISSSWTGNSDCPEGWFKETSSNLNSEVSTPWMSSLSGQTHTKDHTRSVTRPPLSREGWLKNTAKLRLDRKDKVEDLVSKLGNAAGERKQKAGVACVGQLWHE